VEPLKVIEFVKNDGFEIVPREAINDCPRREGVYCLLAKVDTALCVLYVGTAANIQSRLNQHLKHDAPWTNAAYKTVPDTSLSVEGNKVIRANGWFNRGEEEMRLLWDYLPPWNKAYNPNKTFVQLAKIVFGCEIGLYPEISQGLGLSENNASAAERKLRSLLKHSGIERRIHERVDGQFRALLNREKLDSWLVGQIGVSYSQIENAIDERRERRYEEQRRQAAGQLNAFLTQRAFSATLEIEPVQR